MTQNIDNKTVNVLKTLLISHYRNTYIVTGDYPVLAVYVLRFTIVNNVY